MSPVEPRWLSIPAASLAYGLHVQTLYSLCKQKKIPFVKIPSIRPGGRGQIRIDRRRYDEQLERQEIVLDEQTARMSTGRRTPGGSGVGKLNRTGRTTHEHEKHKS